MPRLRQQLRGVGTWLVSQWRHNPLGSVFLILVLVILAAITVETVRLGNTGFEDKTLWDWLELLLVPVALALGGSVFGIYLTRTVEARQKRDTVTIEVYHQYLARYRDFGRVRHLLRDAQESELLPGDKNDIRDFGNWLDLVATLANQALVNTALLAEWKLDPTLCDFFDQAGRFTFLANARQESWRNLHL
jgi:hypothetical protein